MSLFEIWFCMKFGYVVSYFVFLLWFYCILSPLLAALCQTATGPRSVYDPVPYVRQKLCQRLGIYQIPCLLENPFSCLVANRKCQGGMPFDDSHPKCRNGDNWVIKASHSFSPGHPLWVGYKVKFLQPCAGSRSQLYPIQSVRAFQ